MKQSLNEKLHPLIVNESRTCPICMFVIENPFIENCPRCATALQKLEVGCSACQHKSQCSFSNLSKIK